MIESELKMDYFFENVEQFIFPTLLVDCKSPWSLLKKSKEFLNLKASTGESQIMFEILENVYINGWVSIGKNVEISNNVTIEGPVIIGDNCKIGPGAFIRPGSIISNNCSIGHGSEIKNSVIFSGAKVASLCFVGDSIIGKGARIGSGTITANRRFDQKNIGLKFKGQFIDFETDYFGCVLGDYSRIGANCTTLPGTIVGPYTWILPLTRIGGFIPRQKIVENEQHLVLKDNEIVKLND